MNAITKTGKAQLVAKREPQVNRALIDLAKMIASSSLFEQLKIPEAHLFYAGYVRQLIGMYANWRAVLDDKLRELRGVADALPTPARAAEVKQAIADALKERTE